MLSNSYNLFKTPCHRQTHFLGAQSNKTSSTTPRNSSDQTLCNTSSSAEGSSTSTTLSTIHTSSQTTSTTPSPPTDPYNTPTHHSNNTQPHPIVWSPGMPFQ